MYQLYHFHNLKYYLFGLKKVPYRTAQTLLKRPRDLPHIRRAEVRDEQPRPGPYLSHLMDARGLG